MKLNVAGYINCSTSYSLLTMNFLREMLNAGVQIRLFPMDNPTPASEQFSREIQSTFYRNNNPSHFRDAPSLRFGHQFDLFNHVSKPRIGYTVFELDDLTPLEQDSVLSTDIVITPNNYHANVLKKYHDNVHVVPIGVDTTLFGYSGNPIRQMLNIPEDATLFCCIGKIERRKCFREMCEAFSLAFDPGDNVYFALVSENPFVNNEEWKSLYKNSKMGSQIVWLKKFKNHSDIANLLKDSDCLVAPSRAEGWNMPILEKMCSGGHVITTNVTAMADYCSPINSHLIELDEMESAFDPPFFQGQGNWYKWEHKHTERLASLMRDIHEKKQKGSLERNINGVATAASFSYSSATQKLLEIIYETDT